MSDKELVQGVSNPNKEPKEDEYAIIQNISQPSTTNEMMEIVDILQQFHSNMMISPYCTCTFPPTSPHVLLNFILLLV